MSSRRDLDAVAVVEACYRETASDTRWMDDLFEVADPLVNYGPGFGFAL